MSGNFKVGDICILQNDPKLTDAGCERYGGEEVEVVGRAQWAQWEDGVAGWVHEVRAPDGEVIYAFVHELRKQPPSGEQSVYDLFKLPAPSKTMEAA